MFPLFKKKKIIVTHNGSFHADDIFACATLMLFLEQKGERYRIIRTRDEAEIHKADFVVDVGGEYNPEKNLFDHHQIGGAGARDGEGIPYASFGLVWKKFGPLLCKSQEIVIDIDKRIVEPIDAIDNGISISEPRNISVCDYGLYGIIGAYQNTWKEAGATDKQLENFLFLVRFFKKLLKREIERSSDRIEMVRMIEEIYENSSEKVILEIPFHVTTGILNQALDKHKEIMFIVSKSNTQWKALAMRKNPCSFENRKSFPLEWGGKKGAELAQISGVSDAVFCHNARFLAVAETKEGAWELARRALEN
ncbi:MAG: MYG1 family protein [Candidatus Pacebacteria bacterium]|nr:MYG1 family protein [Candidatus Paceibacterota bacterium]